MAEHEITDVDGPASDPPIADAHDVIRVIGARENNLTGVDVEIPKRRLTVFTGVSGSGKSSLVFGTIATESQRLINETYPTFVQQFMAQLSRPEVDGLENISPAIIVDQERMGANARSTVGTATDAYAMLRLLFSRLGEPRVGSPQAFSFNIPTVPGSDVVTGGMCPRCEGLGEVSDVDLDELFDSSKSLAEGAITVPGYNVDGWMVRIFTESGFLDAAKPIAQYTEQERADFLYKEPTKVKLQNMNMTYEGLVPKITKSFLQKDREALQPHIRAFVDRAVKFLPCPECGGSRLNEGARSCRIGGVNIAEAAAMQITDLAAWLDTIDATTVGPLLSGLRKVIASFVDIGLGYLSLDRSSGTLSGGEAQRTKMIRHLGSALTDVTYVFDEPTAGLHPHDIQRMNDLLLLLRDKGNTVLVVEHKPEVIAIADHVVDLGPHAGSRGGRIMYEGDVAGLRASDTLTGRHLDHRAALKTSTRPATGALQIRGATQHNLTGVDVDIPLGVLTVVTGVAGSGKSSTHPRQRPVVRRRRRRRPVADQGVAPLQPRDLHGRARCDPHGVREGERGEGVAIQRELRGCVPGLQGARGHHHEPRLHAERRDAVRGLRRVRLQRSGARVHARRQEHRRGARDVRRGGARVHDRTGQDDARSHDRRRSRLHHSRSSAQHALGR